jgi:radical SAM protein with 4Fe4S-binding SPASM domain
MKTTLEQRSFGADAALHEYSIPVISPDWRVKRSGDWVVLWKYDPDDIVYVTLPPIVAAIAPLFNGELNVAQVARVLSYSLDISVEQALTLVAETIMNINHEQACVIEMNDSVGPFVKHYDAREFIVSPDTQRQQKRFAAPLNLNVMFSNNCQTRCAYCYAYRRRMPRSEELSLQRWAAIFREAKELGIEQISLSGGDPLFRADAPSLIAELVNLDMLFLVSTKCHVTAEIADALVLAGMNRPINQFTRDLQISLDGPDHATADVLAGSRGYLDRAVDSICNLIERGFDIRVKAVVTPLNAPRLYEWADMLNGLGVRRISCAAYGRSYYRHTDSLFLSSRDRELAIRQFQRIRADFPEMELVPSGFEEVASPVDDSHDPSGTSIGLDDQIGKPNSEKVTAWQRRSACSGGRTSLTVAPDGKVTLCDTVPQAGVFVVGDLSNHSIVDVWQSDSVVQVAYPSREAFVGTECYDCEERLNCHYVYGYCFRDSYFNYGTPFCPPPKCPRAPDDGLRME